MRHARRAPLMRDGFTLIELMVVIFIIGLFAAVVVPSLGTSRGELKHDARTVASLLRDISDTSAAKKTVIPLKFDFKKKIVTAGFTENPSPVRLESLSGVETKGGGLVAEGELTLYFDPAAVGDHIVVYLKSGDEEYSVWYNPISRRVKIVHGDEE